MRQRNTSKLFSKREISWLATEGRYGYGMYVNKALTTEDKKVSCSKTRMIITEKELIVGSDHDKLQ